MLRTRENSDVFNSLDEIYLVFTEKKQISSIYPIFSYQNIYENTIKIMCFDGTIIAIKRFRKTNCARISYAHVIVEIIAE